MSKECKICKTPWAGYTLENKRVCLTCDELTFDMMIELEDEEIDIKPAKNQPKTEITAKSKE